MLFFIANVFCEFKFLTLGLTYVVTCMTYMYAVQYGVRVSKRMINTLMYADDLLEIIQRVYSSNLIRYLSCLVTLISEERPIKFQRSALNSVITILAL